MAILTGVKAARAGWIATLDADGQNDPADIPRLWEIARSAPASPPLMIAGQRRKRRDNWSKRAASRAANAIRRAFLATAHPIPAAG